MDSSHLSLSSSVFAVISKISAPAPLRSLVRAAAIKLRPPSPRLYRLQTTDSLDRAMAQGGISERQLATVLVEKRLGGTPTIVLGGFVPDAFEQVFLLREQLLRQGSVYYFTYSRSGFSMDAVCAQLDDLVREINRVHGQAPVIFSASFGCGVVLEWTRRSRAEGHEVAGVICVSPVACAEDLIGRNEAKPSTLVGRALKPYLDLGGRLPDQALTEKSRAVFTRMFESGAQNRDALLGLMTAEEMVRLKNAVLATIRGIEPVGACERVFALRDLTPLEVPAPGTAPVSEVPALFLYAEKETSVLREASPTRLVLQQALQALFPEGQMAVVTGEPESPVQHASLIFHYPQFRGPVLQFYQGLKSRKIRLAA